MHAKVGDPVKLGTCLVLGIEPADRWGRLVAIRHKPEGEMQRYVIRQYAPGDGDFPTGDYCTTSGIWLCPHQVEEGECRESESILRSLARTA